MLLVSYLHVSSCFKRVYSVVECPVFVVWCVCECRSKAKAALKNINAPGTKLKVNNLKIEPKKDAVKMDLKNNKCVFFAFDEQEFTLYYDLKHSSS